MKNIFVIGQCTLHWGRLEYGNIGNYYITETTFRELHRVFPNAKIVTTFQMTEEFSKKENIQVVPMNLFYQWENNDLDIALKEYAIALFYNKTGELIEKTPFIEQVLKADLVIDFSGELWGDHAEPVGKNRFLVGLLKDRIAQLLNKKTVLLAGSQGPFSDKKILNFAKEVFANFDLVANREAASIELLKEYGFNVSKVKNFTDAAFLFEAFDDNVMHAVYEKENLNNKEKPIVGFIICGFNMPGGTLETWPRKDKEFMPFVKSVEHIVNNLKAKVVFLSHQNGFELPPNFKLITGRDFPFAQKLYELTLKRGNVKEDDLHCIANPYLPKQTKAIIQKFDMLVTGRIHGFVAAVSQYVPAVIINRGNSPKSLRNIGFAQSVKFENYMANPNNSSQLIELISECWVNREILKAQLYEIIPSVKLKAHKMYDSLLEI